MKLMVNTRKLLAAGTDLTGALMEYYGFRMTESKRQQASHTHNVPLRWRP